MLQAALKQTLPDQPQGEAGSADKQDETEDAASEPEDLPTAWGLSTFDPEFAKETGDVPVNAWCVNVKHENAISEPTHLGPNDVSPSFAKKFGYSLDFSCQLAEKHVNDDAGDDFNRAYVVFTKHKHLVQPEDADTDLCQHILKDLMFGS